MIQKICTCELRPAKPYSYNVTGTTPQECRIGCDDPTSGGTRVYHNYNSHICLQNCNDDHSDNIYHANGGYICYPSCRDIPNDLYKYELGNVCHKTKPSHDKCPYYYIKSNGIIKCVQISECKNLFYFHLLGDECKSKCEDFYYKYNDTEIIPGENVPFMRCFSTPTECYNNIGALTYYNKKLRRCWKEYVSDYFINKISTTLYELVDECENFYYKDSDNHNYCTSSCFSKSLFFLSGNKKCVSSCTEFNKYYYDPITNECVDSCKQIVNYPFQKDLPSSSAAPSACLSVCPSLSGSDDRYHNYDSNICLERCGKDGSSNKYHKYDDYVCYPSCTEIPKGNFIYEYLSDTTNYIYSCYDKDNLPLAPSGDCPFYYLKNDGTKKCQKLADCRDRNYIYLLEDECRDRCDEYYKLNISLSYETGKTGNFVRCYKTPTNCLEYHTGDTSAVIYYFIKLKRCFDGFPSEYFIKNEPSGSYVMEVIEKCEKFYYVDGDNRKICTDDCKSHNLYFLIGYEKCETDCINYKKNYYDPDNNECVDTCKERNIYKFQEKITTTLSSASKCLDVCPSNSSYYDSDSNICLTHCGAGDPSKLYRKFGTDGKICYSSCVEIPDGQYIYEHSDGPHFACYDTPPTGDGIDCGYYFTKSDGTRRCTNMTYCINNIQYKYFLGTECKDSCDGYYKLEVTDTVKNLNYTKCFDSITDVLKPGNGVKAYNIRNKLCWGYIPDGYFVNNITDVTTSEKKYEMVKECEFYYYKCKETASVEYNKCEVSCYSVDLFFIQGQKNCESNCLVFNKHYYNKNNHECLDICKDLVGYQFSKKIESQTQIEPCIESCESTEAGDYNYYDYNSKICIKKCGDDNIYNLYHAYDEKICYPSCKEIAKDIYRYESVNQGDDTKICYEGVPTGCEYFYMKKDGTLKCLSGSAKCLEMKYNYVIDYELGAECKSECDDYYKLEDIDPTSQLIHCFKTRDECLNFGYTATDKAKYYNSKLKKCWISFPHAYYINKIETLGSDEIFEIVQECENYYYPDTLHENHYKCVNNCSIASSNTPPYIFFCKEQKNCENSCKNFNKYHKDPKNNECLDTCIGRKSEGTYIEFADEVDHSATDPVVECKEACTSSQHYNYGTKVCINDPGCSGENPYKYDDDTENICYNTCDEVPVMNKLYELNNICYKDRPTGTNCNYYYKKSYKILQCVDSVSKCIEAGYNYLYEDECKKNCDNYYKLMDGNNIKICYDNYEYAFSQNRTYKFYDITLKQCWMELPEGYFIKHDNNGVNYEIVSECEHYYYYNESNCYNYCIDNCKDVELYFIEQNKKCETSCSNPAINKFYYDPADNNCLDTCVGKDNLEYALPLDASNPTRPCISKCPNPRYFKTYTDKGHTHYECLKHCPEDSTSAYKFLDIKTNECRYDCPDHFINNQICYPKCDLANNYTYINTDTYDCVKACPSELKSTLKLTSTEGKEFFLCKSICEIDKEFRVGDECVKKCPNGHNYIGFNNICKENCREDANGQHYYPVNEDESPEYLIYKCIDSCDEAIISEDNTTKNYLFYTESDPNKCLRKCPSESHFYLGSNPHECISSCPFKYPFYDGVTPNYECKAVSHCGSGHGTSIYFFEGQCLSIAECQNRNKNYIESRNICMDICPDNEIKTKIEGYSGAYQCLRHCLGKYILQTNVEDPLECVEDCPKVKNFIGKDNKCKQSCEEEDGLFYYKYTENIIDSDSGEKYTIYKCVDGCKEDYDDHKYKEANNGNECYQMCTNNYPYLSAVENLCYDECLKSTQNTFTITLDSKCAEKCDDSTNYIYWGENKNCTDSCSHLGDATITNYNNQCVSKCDFTSTYKFELNEKCVDTCYQSSVSTSKLRYSLGDYKCKEKCGDEEFIINENQCVTTCNEFINVTDTGERECIPFCGGDKKYYYKNEKKCLDKCKPGHKIVEDLNICVDACNDITDKNYYLYVSVGHLDTFSVYDMCVLNCPVNKPYIYRNVCVEYCPYGSDDNRYFVESVINPHKICLNDCPPEYPYYTKNTVSGKDYYPCKADCPGYFVENINSLINAKLCLESCPDSSYPEYQYKLEYEEDGKKMKQCYEECPHEYNYHLDVSSSTVTDNNCYRECPGELKVPYHRKGENICRKQSELSTGYLLYDTKEWDNLTKCPDDYNLTSQIENTGSNIVIICLKKCNFEYYDEGNNKYYLYEYLTQNNTCVKDCSTSLPGEHFINDGINKKCVCENLFYVDEETSLTVCYDSSITRCKDVTTADYRLPLYGSKRCLRTCNENRILTPTEDECYEANTPCSSMLAYSNTKLITKSNGLKKCECMYKFYMNDNKKMCLKEDDICPEGRNWLIPNTMECIASCPSEADNNYPYKFQTFCLNLCPLRSAVDETNKQCDCGERYWYEKSHGNFECLLDNCISDYPVSIETTKECVKTCKGTYYKYLYNNKCYGSCNFIVNTIEKTIDSSLGEYTCFCKKFWYYDIDDKNKMICPPDNTDVKKCRDYINKDVPYLVEATGQCVNKCPSDYPYYFNHICYSSCEYANEAYKLNIETVDYSHECHCQNVWMMDPSDIYGTDIICFEKNKNDCELSFDEEGRSITYFINSTRQCVNSRDDCQSKSYKFNHVCYEQCPEFSLEAKEILSGDVTDNICTCNRNGYYWLDYEKYGNTYYKCGLTYCPEIFIDGEQEYYRKNLLESESKCVKSCLEDGAEGNKYLFSFRKKCIQKCPTLTETIYDECVFLDVYDEDKVSNLDILKEAANVQAKELYEKSDHIGGFFMNKYDASLQIYALTKLNSYKELSMKSNLTYIDLGTCFDKIYTDNHLNDTDKILVTKYDLLTRLTKESDGNENDNDNEEGENNNNGNTAQSTADEKFLINQVEYEFYLERTMEKLEGSICSPYEILISYPIFFNKHKYNAYEDGINNNNYTKLFQIGKMLHEDDPDFDTFNKDNIIYKELCKRVEIDGKDLVLEERYNYLYPNNVSLCESNCTMNNTDFELQRINCNCTYKEIFDFYRIDEDKNDILNDPNFPKPTQSNTNAEIIKCLGKIEGKKGIVKNEAFYYTTLIFIVQVSAILVTVLKSIKYVVNLLRELLKADEEAIKYKNENVKNKNNKNSVKSISNIDSINKLVNNPPKKGSNNDDDDDKNDYNNNNLINISSSNKLEPNKVKLNYIPIDNNSKNDISRITINSNNNLESNIRPGYQRVRRRTFHINNNLANINNEGITNVKVNNNYLNQKAEFIPPKYNFKFFRISDNGVVKRVQRSEVPFKINPDTKILLEYKEDIPYPKNYLKGPYFEDQNIVEIIEDNDQKNPNTIIPRNNKNEKVSRYNPSLKNSYVAESIIASKKAKNESNMADYSKKNGIQIVKPKKEIKNYITKEKEITKFTRSSRYTPSQVTIDEVKSEENAKKYNSITSIYTLVKREHSYLRVDYDYYLSKKHPNYLAVILAEIFDKIYLIRTFMLLKRFDIFAVHLSLYLFYHILLVSVLCGFFSVKIIKKIWEKSNFPKLNFYLLYGFIANVIIWVIYKLILFFLDNEESIRSLIKYNKESIINGESNEKLKRKNSDSSSQISDDELLKKNTAERYEELIKKMKIKIIIYFVVMMVLTIFCSFYLLTFFAFYTGTKRLVIKAYYISIIEIILIKFVCGVGLSYFRIAAERNESTRLYRFVYICDKYFS